MAVAPATRPRVYDGDECVILPHVSWDTYERLLADDQDRRVPRMTYDRGMLELVTPSMPHEVDAGTITRVVDIVSAVLGIPMVSAGGTTYRRKDLARGFEPDASFYLQSEPRIRGKREIDLSIDPPPDLVVEMEVSRTAMSKLALFASMGIPEVWRCDGERVRIFVREGAAYREASSSLAIPSLTNDVLNGFLAQSRTMLSPDWFQAVSDWARSQHASSP